MQKYVIAVHGGAGTIRKGQLSAKRELGYRAGLETALKTGIALLASGGSALDAVQAAVVVLENDPHFNAGRGAVLTHEGLVELDASIMDGSSLRAGAVAAVRNLRNPVILARAVMDQSPHVLLSGRGAEDFARKLDLPFEPDEYFITELRRLQWEHARAEGRTELDHNSEEEKKFGTVGAVAFDVHGNLAAATSTGGMTNKMFGRIGDSPLIGAGTYANNATCAVSCTGHGEFFIRGVVAYDVSCLMEYKGLSLQQACEEVVMNKLLPLGGEGGLIAVDTRGNCSLSFNSEGMYRGRADHTGIIETAIYKVS